MALNIGILQDILNEIKTSFDKVYLVSGAQSSVILGNSITGYPVVSNPVAINLVWGGASGGSLTTTNSPDDGNAINFSVKVGLTGKTLAIVEESYIVATIDLTTDIVAGSWGTGAFINTIQISLTEV